MADTTRPNDVPPAAAGTTTTASTTTAHDPALNDPTVRAGASPLDSVRAAPGLVSDVLTHVSNLVRKEVDLARTEVSENVSRAGVAIGLLVGALIIALVALNVLAAALVAALTALGIPAGWSAIIVGGVLAIIAFAMVSKGVNDLKLSSLAPTRTAKNVQRDAETVKETLQ